MIQTTQQRIPVTIISGFLGAGKTTLLNHLLHSDHGLRVAVLVNDFGAINIDTELIVGVEGETVSLANGCICCTIRGDLEEATLQILRRSEPPEYLIIETSGVSDPRAVGLTFMLSPELLLRTRIDGVITVIDAEQVPLIDDDYRAVAFAQLQAADIIVLNKADLIDAQDMAELKRWVAAIVPRARMLEANYGQVSPALLLGVGQFDPEQLPPGSSQPLAVHVHAAPNGPEDDLDHDHSHDHTLVFDTWSYTTARPFVYQAVREVIKNLPTTIFRAKGKLYVAESDRQAVFHVVGKRAAVSLTQPWGEQTPHSQIVVIGVKDGVNGDDEARSLGIDPGPLRRVVIVVSTALTALAVSVSGIIAWVGLLVPHAARLIVGPDHRYVIPLSATLGAVFVMVCDDVARTISTGEVPIGIITSILGAPYLVYLLRTRATRIGVE